MIQKRARSRLKKTPATTVTRRATRPVETPPRRLSPRHLRHTPLIFLAGMFYAGLYWLFTTIHPDQISNILLPNSFIPLHLLFFGGNFFLFTFLTLRKRWGLFIALAIEWLVVLKLQEVTLDIWAILSAVIIGGGGWLLRTLWKNQVSNL